MEELFYFCIGLAIYFVYIVLYLLFLAVATFVVIKILIFLGLLAPTILGFLILG